LVNSFSLADKFFNTISQNEINSMLITNSRKNGIIKMDGQNIRLIESATISPLSKSPTISRKSQKYHLKCVEAYF